MSIESRFAKQILSMESKVMDLHEAISKSVRDGSNLAMGALVT